MPKGRADSMSVPVCVRLSERYGQYSPVDQQEREVAFDERQVVAFHRHTTMY